ncbi:MAG: hypothetical protein GX896_00920 [Clostridiales bacterium]|nr:hypothetical protein [Clostridiales bacterium]
MSKEKNVIRDSIKRLGYFNDFIAEDTKRIEMFMKKLITNGVREDRILPV